MRRRDDEAIRRQVGTVRPARRTRRLVVSSSRRLKSLILALLCLAGAPLARAVDAQDRKGILDPPAYSYERAKSKLLNVLEDGSEMTTNLGKPLCILFVVDVSGSMAIPRPEDGEPRIDRALRHLQGLLKMPELRDAYLGIMKVGPEDPGRNYRDPSHYVASFDLFDDEDSAARLDRRIQSLNRLRAGRDRGSNLRAAHYRGLQAIARFCWEHPGEWRRYLVMLTDGFPSDPESAETPGQLEPAIRIYQRLKDPGSEEFREWQRLAEEGQTETLVIEPYNRNWERDLFPREIAAGIASLQTVEQPCEALVEGVCLEGGEGTASSVETVGDPAQLRRLDSERPLPEVRVMCAVSSLNRGPTGVGGREAPGAYPRSSDQGLAAPAEQIVSSNLGGRFFVRLQWRPEEPETPKFLTLSADKRWFRSASSQQHVEIQPGDHSVWVISLAPKQEPLLIAAALLGLIGLVWLFWPWELRIDNGKPSRLHLFAPVVLFDPNTHRRVAKVYHIFCNWLVAGAGAQVRINGSQTLPVRPIPGSCQVQVMARGSSVTHRLASGFMIPGRRG